MIILEMNAVIVAVTEDAPRVLVLPATESEGEPPRDALPFGPLDEEGDATLERGLRAWVKAQAGLDLGYVEQLYTFGDRHRDPREHGGGPRVISTGYLALARESSGPRQERARWRNWYDYLPWEDWRQGRPGLIDEKMVPALRDFANGDASRRERVAVCMGLGGAPWDAERTLERYELLYEAGLVAESGGDCGRPMALDHRRILATALGRLRGKVRYRPVVFELLPESFTLLDLQRVVEALAGSALHKQNFRRLVERAGLVERTGRRTRDTGGRPAELFKFRPEVLLERPAPGVHFSGAKWR